MRNPCLGTATGSRCRRPFCVSSRNGGSPWVDSRSSDRYQKYLRDSGGRPAAFEAKAFQVRRIAFPVLVSPARYALIASAVKSGGRVVVRGVLPHPRSRVLALSR